MTPRAGALRAMARALPPRRERVRLSGLSAPAELSYDRSGTPHVAARDRADAMRMLGYATARERFWQMDVLRRRAAGRLSELFGAAALESDLRARRFGFGRVAREVAARLVPAQRAVLEAFAGGVNAQLERARAPAWEHAVLGVEAEPWRIEDSVAIELALFDELCGEIGAKRTVTGLEAALPRRAARLFSSDDDPYAVPLRGGERGRRPAPASPVEVLRALVPPCGCDPWAPADWIEPAVTAPGSNAWAVAGGAGRPALLANDLHMGLGVPNAVFPVRLAYGAVDVRGFVVPGFPALICGTSAHVAWGVTNLCGDNLDLVALDDDDGDGYSAAAGRRRFVRRTETIAVRGADPVRLEVEETCWGPVADEPLLGGRCAYRWAALDPRAVDAGLAFLHEAADLDDLLERARAAAGPPLNVIAAGRDGRVGWTLTGRLPRRAGTAHHAALRSSALRPGPAEYLAPAEHPVRIESQAGRFLVTANNRVVGRAGPDVGRNFASGFRADRIARELRAGPNQTLAAAAALQTDADGAFYAFYRGLALDHHVLAAAGEAGPAVAALLHGKRWARAGSDAVAFLGRLRDLLVRALLAAYLAPCRARDPGFTYRWANVEHTVRAVLLARDPVTFPFAPHCAGWPEFLGGACARALATPSEARTPPPRPSVVLRHPLSPIVPELAPLIDQRRVPHRGGFFMIRVAHGAHGAVVRFVAHPGGACATQMPCGASGNPRSPHYADRHAQWAGERYAAFPSRVRRVTSLVTARPAPASAGAVIAKGQRREIHARHRLHS